MRQRIGTVGFLGVLSSVLAGNARGEEIEAKFLKNGQQTITVRPDLPGKLVVVNPSSHRFRCTHLTEGLRVVATPAKDVDVTLQVASDGRKGRPPIDRGGPGNAERYDGHPPLGATTFHIQAKSAGGPVVVTWTWDPRCHEKSKAEVPAPKPYPSSQRRAALSAPLFL